jgi:hypothetical protein
VTQLAGVTATFVAGGVGEGATQCKFASDRDSRVPICEPFTDAHGSGPSSENGFQAWFRTPLCRVTADSSFVVPPSGGCGTGLSAEVACFEAVYGPTA